MKIEKEVKEVKYTLELSHEELYLIQMTMASSSIKDCLVPYRKIEYDKILEIYNTIKQKLEE